MVLRCVRHAGTPGGRLAPTTSAFSPSQAATRRSTAARKPTPSGRALCRAAMAVTHRLRQANFSTRTATCKRTPQTLWASAHRPTQASPAPSSTASACPPTPQIFWYTQPQLAGGINTSANTYAAFLRKLLDHSLLQARNSTPTPTPFAPTVKPAPPRCTLHSPPPKAPTTASATG